MVSIADNGSQLTEVGDYEAQNFKQPQMMIRSNTFQFTTKPPILVRCCYVSVFFFIFCAWEIKSLNHLL
jgi:hypothetical protein